LNSQNRSTTTVHQPAPLLYSATTAVDHIKAGPPLLCSCPVRAALFLPPSSPALQSRITNRAAHSNQARALTLIIKPFSLSL
jgi:hypothetical protein